MIIRYIILALRNLIRHKLYSAINIITLSLAVTTAILILNYVVFEFSYDKIHTKGDNIYRVESQFYEAGTLTDDWATSSYGYGVAMKDKIAGVADFVRFDINNCEQIVSYNYVKYRENGVTSVDSNFLSMFDFELRSGDRATVLNGPNKVLITESMAQKYFKSDNPLGKRLRFNSMNGIVDCEVTGVLEDIGKNSSINFDFFISWATLPKELNNFWYRHEVYTYVELDKGITPSSVEAAFPIMAEQYKTEDALRNKTWAVVLNPLSDIHLTPMKQYERESKGNKNSLIALIIVALAVLTIAWVNYVNLSTARSAERANEVGVRKVSGANKGQLIGQFLFDSMVTNILAFITATFLVSALQPIFGALTGKAVTFIIFSQPIFWVGILAILIAGVVLSGLYPAYLISQVSPLIVMGGSYVRSRGAGMIRKGLLVVQFVAAIVLISSSIIVWQQIRYMINAPTGVKTSNILAIKYPARGDDADFELKLQAFKRQIEQNPLTQSVSLSNSIPGMEVATFLSNRLASDATMQNRLYEMVSADYDFIKTYDLPIIEGRAFGSDYLGDENKLIINRAALGALNIAKPSEAIGQKVYVESVAEPLEIVGVVENYHQQVLSKSFTPLMFIRENCINWIALKYISVSHAPTSNIEPLRRDLERSWNSFFPHSTFDSFVVGDFYAQGYDEDTRFATIFAIFGMLALVISVVGLWVLTLFSLSVRKKEIALRKIYGASWNNIFKSISSEFFTLALVAVVIAIPISWWVMNSYLGSYPFRVSISLLMFVLPVVLVFAITFGTIALQIRHAMRHKPQFK